MRPLLLPAFLFLAIALSAQNAVEITAEPHHHLVLENSYVRAFAVDVAPGDSTLVHIHRHDIVSVVFGPAEISNEVLGKPPVQSKVQDGHTGAGNAGIAHAVRNVGATHFRNVTIELLQDEKAKKSPPPKWDEDRGLQILEGGTQDIMFVKDGVRVSETEFQPGGMTHKYRHPGPYLIVALTDLSLRSDVAGKRTSPVVLKTGDMRWFAGADTDMLMNVSQQPAKFVTLEFH